MKNKEGINLLAQYFTNAATQLKEGADPVVVLIDTCAMCMKMLKIARIGADK